MANELTVTCILSFTKGNVRAAGRRAVSTKFDVSGSKYVSNIQEIDTSEEALAMGDVATAGWMWAKNLDDTNFVELRMGTGEADLIKLKAGEFCCVRLSGNDPYAIADNAACDLEYFIVED